jgi:hypothetical protein
MTGSVSLSYVSILSSTAVTHIQRPARPARALARFAHGVTRTETKARAALTSA